MKKSPLILVGVAALLLSACGSSSSSTDSSSSTTGSDATTAGSSAVAEASCAPVAEVKTIAPGELTIAVAEYPPFIYKDGDSISGADGEFLKRLAAALCLKPNIQQTSFTAIIEGLKSNRVDISAGDWTLNDERKQLFEVSEPVYADLQGIISKEGYDTVDKLMGKKVGTAAGYLVVEDMQKTFGADNVPLYQSDVEGYQDLKAGRIDAYLSGLGALAFMLRQNGDTEMKNVVLAPDQQIPATVNPSYAVALMTKGNEGLRDAANKVLDEYRSSGDLAAQLTSDGVDPSSAEISAS